MDLHRTLEDKRFYSLSEMAAVCDVTPAAVLYWCRTGKVRGYGRTSARGKYRIPRIEVIRTLRRRRTEAPGLWTAKKRILVIDSYPPIAKLIRSILDHAGVPADVSACPSAGDGIILAGRLDPDLLFVDHGFPASDFQGLQALAVVRDSRLLRGVKVVGMGSFPALGSQMRSAGAHAFLLKPFGRKELLDAVTPLLR